MYSYFNPLPSCEGRHDRICGRGQNSYFNPLPSCEGRPIVTVAADFLIKFQSTPLMRGETPARVLSLSTRIISIHSPHARGDACTSPSVGATKGFQSTPLMRGETIDKNRPVDNRRFQSTPLMRGETTKTVYINGIQGFQSTPLMRGETDWGTRCRV